MWSPATAEELANAIDGGSLPHEAAAFEVKAQLPASKASQDIAVDVAAMATAGGVIVYGVSEDKKAMTFTAAPLELAGVKDRISDVVSASVRERIEFALRSSVDGRSDAVSSWWTCRPHLGRPIWSRARGSSVSTGRVPGGNVVLTEAQIRTFTTVVARSKDKPSELSTRQSLRLLS